jgi:hypothetical protein
MQQFFSKKPQIDFFVVFLSHKQSVTPAPQPDQEYIYLYLSVFYIYIILTTAFYSTAVHSPPHQNLPSPQTILVVVYCPQTEKTGIAALAGAAQLRQQQQEIQPLLHTDGHPDEARAGGRRKPAAP